MKQSFYFYDLETTGLDTSSHRISQYSGQRTDLDFNPIGKPFTTYVQLEPGIVPDVMAMITTGVSPQTSNREGITEIELFEHLEKEVFTPGTVVVGYNNIAFDDELIRYGRFRNLYDPYSWAWKDDRSRWDILPVIRMTRALRPEGIEWAFDEDEKPVNKLEALTVANGIHGGEAHDAENDVKDLIALANKLKQAQPKLFDYLFMLRNKHAATELIQSQPIFVHSSSNIRNAPLGTSLFTSLGEMKYRQGSMIGYDLRFDPTSLLGKTADELHELLYTKDADPAVPLKTISPNKSPALAPAGTFNTESEERNELTLEAALNHLNILRANPDLQKALKEAIDRPYEGDQGGDVERSLYSGGFTSRQDAIKLEAVRNSILQKDSSITVPVFDDERFTTICKRAIARNLSSSSVAPDILYEQHELIKKRLQGQLKGMTSLQSFVEDIQKHSEDGQLSEFMKEELLLWAEELYELLEVSD